MTPPGESRVWPRNAEAILASVVWCRLGSGEHGGRRWDHPIQMFGKEVGTTGFLGAKHEGLLSQDPVWRATDAGEQLLRDEGLLPIAAATSEPER